MLEGYLGVLLLIAVAALISTAMVTLSWVLGPKKVTPYKSAPYECGVEPVGDIHERFPIKFYLVAMLFILFDIEVVFLWGWMTTFLPAARAGDTTYVVFSFFEMLLYMSTWVLGYVYAIRVGAINWDETISLPERTRAQGEADMAVAS
ncbi:MAG: NADH-quinone oxidoreductase subunit A [Fimbriimonadaceae bacterium]|nr:NADH-quinone oxidoreductase subunit A [Fimbriimonadaceae bacterium]